MSWTAEAFPTSKEGSSVVLGPKMVFGDLRVLKLSRMDDFHWTPDDPMLLLVGLNPATGVLRRIFEMGESFEEGFQFKREELSWLPASLIGFEALLGFWGAIERVKGREE